MKCQDANEIKINNRVDTVQREVKNLKYVDEEEKGGKFKIYSTVKL